MTTSFPAPDSTLGYVCRHRVPMPKAAVIPEGAASARSVPDVPAQHRLHRRPFHRSRALSNELRHRLLKQAAKTTGAMPFVQGVGQNLFREGLLDLWEARCAVTGLTLRALLRACETDAERPDVYNGFLLAPHLDVAVDQGFITVADDGAIVMSDALDADARALLGLDRPLRVRRITGDHLSYLPWHRAHVFRDRLAEGGAS